MVLTALAVLVGCGQKGPLTLPGDAGATVPTEVGSDTNDDDEQEQN